MAKGLNKVMIIGRIQPNDPELRYTQSGQPVCTFKIVTDESYKDKDGNNVERAEWHSIVFWGKPGEIIAQYMKKGRQIYIEGRLQTRKYDDKDGVTRYVTEIVGSDFAFLDGGNPRSDEASGGGSSQQNYSQNTNTTSATQSSSQADAPSPVADDDLPF